jgi:hypothetical protein
MMGEGLVGLLRNYWPVSGGSVISIQVPMNYLGENLADLSEALTGWSRRDELVKFVTDAGASAATQGSEEWSIQTEQEDMAKKFAVVLTKKFLKYVADSSKNLEVLVEALLKEATLVEMNSSILAALLSVS